MESLASILSHEKNQAISNLELEQSKANTLAQEKKSALVKAKWLKARKQELEEKFSQLEKDLKVKFLVSLPLLLS